MGNCNWGCTPTASEFSASAVSRSANNHTPVDGVAALIAANNVNPISMDGVSSSAAPGSPNNGRGK